jgi:LPXTG-motif cell wall-anchored protein
MKNSKIVAAMVGIALIIAIGAMAGRTVSAASPVSLGTASSFAVLAGGGITNTGPTTINGDAGTFPTTTETGFGTVTLTGTNHAGDAVTQGAKTDLVTAYNAAAGSGPASPVVGDLGGQTLAPGVYNSASSLGLTGALTLFGSSSDVWIFQAGSTLTTASGSSVVLSGGAQSCNVFWQVGSSATIGTGSAFRGTIIALESITVTTGATIDGRALARNGAVTLDTNTIAISTCSGPSGSTATLPPCEFMANLPNAPCAGARATATPQASPASTPTTATVAPSATPIGTAAPTVAPTPTVASAPTASPGGAGAGLQVLPSTSTGDPVSPLLMLGIALAGIGFLLLRRSIRRS